MNTPLVLEEDPLWCRPIHLLVIQDFTHEVLQDVSYTGLGGWSPCFKYKWKILRNDLAAYGFLIKKTPNHKNEPITDTTGLHINPLQFIAAIINPWILLRII